MLISEIRRVIGSIAAIEVVGGEDIDIRYLLTDSRELLTDAHSTLFFAIRTDHDDGAKYIDGLKRRGVCCFVKENGIAALQALGVYVRSRFTGPVIGITGSNGKTVVKEWLYELLKDDYEVIRSPKSYNSQIGVPLSVWELTRCGCATGGNEESGVKVGSANEESNAVCVGVSAKPVIGIFEAGISEPGEMLRLERIIRPTIGVLTYIGAEHGENFSSIEEKRREKMLLFAHTERVIEDGSHQNARTCAAVLRTLGYDEDTIEDRLLHQTHATLLQVNLGALVDNVRFLKSKMESGTKLVCMVKAFAYGTGSVEVSKALEGSGEADYLAVAVADEGVELRKAGINLPIIVMDPEESAMNVLIENNLEPNVYSFQSLQMVTDALESKGVEGYPIHIKIDSGMHRLGFYEEDIAKLCSRLQGKKCVRVVSVFSHFACSDEKQWDEFTKGQAKYFRRCATSLQNGLGYKVLRHISNSAAIERFPQYNFEMCRLGIGMYGLSSARNALRSVCTLKTTLLSIKTVKKGESIGYGRHTVLQSDRQIGVIPIGYADGFDRRFGNYGGSVLVHGMRCPIVGNVCMDQAMVDVTGSDARVGDYVEVFGDHIPLGELCERLGTIPYEILTSISRRVTRQYIYE